MGRPRSDHFCSPEPVFIPLRFLIPAPAEKQVPEPELGRHRAGRADAAFFVGYTQETLPYQAEKQFLCIPCTSVISRTARAYAQGPEFFI
jgi:hypothetical protein